MRLLLIAALVLLSCEQPTDVRPQASTEEATEAPAEETPEGTPEVGPEPEPEPVEEPEEAAEEPSPWLEGWIYLVDVEDAVHYSEYEPSDQLRAAYYDMAAKWTRQERDGYPFRVEEG